MTTYLYSALVSGATIEFNASVDTLSIDTPQYSAGDFSLTSTADGSGVIWSNGVKHSP